MAKATEQLLAQTEAYIQDFFGKNIDPQYVFHDLEHTAQTVAAAKSIGEAMGIHEQDLLLLQLAAWFHDTGYQEGAEGHEQRSCQYAAAFFKGKISADELENIQSCIRATKMPQQPRSVMEQVLCDADLSHLGMETYWDRTGRYRQELILTRNQILTDQAWVDFELDFILGHDYHTVVAREMFNKRKSKHIQQLIKQKRRLSPGLALNPEELALLPENDKAPGIKEVMKGTESDLKMSRIGRGVETMYRTTYRTHTNLSTMADSKANLMLSVNAIVISIIASQLLPKLTERFDWKLAVPTLCLLGTCLGSMIFATLSTRPKITEGRVTREDIKARKANLLFFGNFYNMKLEEFQWGVNEMLKDQEFLYSSMSRDLYFLGIVLAKKYQYLSICYNIFMFGLILSVLAFSVASVF